MCRRFETTHRCRGCRLTQRINLGFHDRCDKGCLSPPTKFNTVLDPVSCHDCVQKARIEKEAQEEEHKQQQEARVARKKAKAEQQKQSKNRNGPKKQQRKGELGGI